MHMLSCCLRQVATPEQLPRGTVTVPHYSHLPKDTWQQCSHCIDDTAIVADDELGLVLMKCVTVLPQCSKLSEQRYLHCLGSNNMADCYTLLAAWQPPTLQRCTVMLYWLLPHNSNCDAYLVRIRDSTAKHGWAESLQV